MSTLRVDFAKGDVSSDLNGLCTNKRVRGMLEGKDFEALDILFPFVGEIVDRTTDKELYYPTMRVHTVLSELEHWLRRKNREEMVSDKFLGSVTVEVRKFKVMVKETFDVHCKRGLYAPKFHFLNQVVEALERFGSLMKVLNISAFQRLMIISNECAAQCLSGGP